MKPGRKYIQFTLRTTDDTDEAAPVARFIITRKQLSLYQRRGFNVIEQIARNEKLSPEQAAAKAMNSVRPTMLGFYGKGDGEAAINDSPIALLAIWYMMFRLEGGFFAVNPKRLEGVHLYFLVGRNNVAPNWPLIKIATSPYEDWDAAREFELPALERLDFWK